MKYYLLLKMKSNIEQNQDKKKVDVKGWLNQVEKSNVLIGHSRGLTHLGHFLNVSLMTP